jgi:hypothetical protein
MVYQTDVTRENTTSRSRKHDFADRIDFPEFARYSVFGRCRGLTSPRWE